MRRSRRLALASALLAAAACTNAGSDRILSVNGTGIVAGVVYFDADGSLSPSLADDSVQGVRVRLVAAADTTQAIASALTAVSGRFRFTGIPVGRYSVRVDAATIGDTMQVAKIDSAAFTLLPSESLFVTVGIGFPHVTIAQARALAAGKRVFVTGVALNAPLAFADSTVHLADPSGFIRLTGVRANFASGDSVRVRAVTGARQGQPVLDDPTAFALGLGHGTPAATLTSAAAASAAAGTRDAQLASVRGATISDTTRTSQSFVLTVSDGSGALQVQLDGTADPHFQTAALPGDFTPGNQFDLIGLLAPTGTGTWRLKPRTAADVTLVPLPVISVAAARALPAGRTAVVVGVVLNGSTTYADSSVFLADGTGGIRLTRLRALVSAGDSVKVRATTATMDGQPTLDAGTTTPLGRGLFPAAATLTTAAAATAQAGARDAQMAVVHGAIISDTARTSDSFVLTASDSSGPLEIQLDRTADPSFQPGALPADFVPGNKFDVVGVLVPTGTGTWRLRPRSAADLNEIPLPVISVAAARALPAGRTAVVIGVALNGSTTYADSSVFLADGTGGIRLTRLRSSVSAGDSVRVRATTATRDGQPTLDAGTTTPLGRGLYPAAATLTTAVAATAAGGVRDAQMVVVHGAIISDTARTTQSFVLTASDSSGPLEIQLDRTADPSFQPGALPADYVPGNKFDAVGILVPTGTGTWRLRPRSAADLNEIPLPVISVAAARALPAGQSAVVVGVALNGTTTFTDTTVSLVDGTGAIRLTRLRASVTAGDSIRVRATTSTRAGQPTLDAGTSTALGRGLFPTAATLTAAVAATAAGGTRDAQLVVVPGVTISDTAAVSGDFLLTVTDTSGTLQVMLDHTADPAFAPQQLPGVFIPGNRFDLVGILVPLGTGTWRLKPRSAADLKRL